MNFTFQPQPHFGKELFFNLSLILLFQKPNGQNGSRSSGKKRDPETDPFYRDFYKILTDSFHQSIFHQFTYLILNCLWIQILICTGQFAYSFTYPTST